jgi:hypothetical protein
LAREVVVMETDPCAWTVTARTTAAVCGGVPESVTWKVTIELVTTAGVPLMTPVEELRDNPAGSLPEITDQV